MVRHSSLAGAVLLAAAVAAGGCGSSASTSTATSPSSISRCAVTVNGDGQVPAGGATRSFNVSAARECAWAASVEGTWLSIKAGAAGQGDGTVEVAAASNPDPQVRRGTIVLNEQRVEMTQAAAECTYTLSEPSGTFAQAGGSGVFDVRAASQLCSWAVSSDSPWIVVRSGQTGRGTAAVSFDVTAGTGTSRTGAITAAGLRFLVSQEPAIPCSFTVSPRAANVAGAGGAVTVTVTTAPTCSWTAASAESWITANPPAAQSGPGTATFSVAAAGAARTGRVVVAGQEVTISQGGACAFTVSPESATAPAAGGEGRVTVSTSDGCAWTVTSEASWITFQGNASRSGSGEVRYQVAPTTGSRSGTMTIAGRVFTVSQSAGCSFTIGPETASVAAGGGELAVAVVAVPGCTWTTASQASWITVGPPGPVDGPGVAQVTVAENKGAARAGTATIAGRTLTVNQAAVPCSYRVSPTEIKVKEEGRFREIEVKAAPGCAWTASSHAPWIQVVRGGSGDGDGEVRISIDENRGDERQGTLTVAGQTVTVIQEED